MVGWKDLVLEDHPTYIASLTGERIDFPERLTLEMTSYCNLMCRMCPKTAGHVNTPANRVIEEGVLEKVYPLLSRIETLQLSGLWGEVFIHPELYLQILEKAKEENCEVRTISNGTLLTPEISERLVEIGLDVLTISIDAATPGTYRQIRVGGDFKKLIKQIKKLQKIKRKKGKDKPELHFGFVGMRQNIQELPDLVNLAAKLDIKSVILQGMGEYEDTKGDSVASHHRDLGKEMYEKALQLGREVGVAVELFPPDQFEDSTVHIDPQRGDLEDVIEIPEGYRKDCDVPWKEVVITTVGDIFPCCSASKPLGNILEEPFEKIWVSKPYQEFRKRLLSSNPPLMCKVCTGIGWKKETKLMPFLKMGETDGQLASGWYMLEENPVWGRKYRWTKDRGVFFLRMPEERRSRMVLQARIAGIPKSGNVQLNGQKVRTFHLEKSQWESIVLDLPKDLEENVIEVEIYVDNPSKEGGDRRRLGVALSEAFFE